MIAIPLPFVTAGLAAVLALRIACGRFGTAGGRVLFAGLFLLCAVLSTLVGLRFGYGVDSVRPMQATLPLLIGPTAYLGFRALCLPPSALRREAAPHAGVALTVAAACLAFPAVRIGSDALIGLSVISYTALLVRQWRRGPEAFAETALSETRGAHRWLGATIALLTLLLILDGLIALDFALTAGSRASLVIAAGSVLLIPALLAAAILIPPAPASPVEPATAAEATENDHALVDRLDGMLAETCLFRDPDLTLSRLARRLGVPARQVSRAVNRVTGGNVSQRVNDHRVRAAATRLADTADTVIDIMTTAGFRTRSNFYREFRRVHGMGPMDFRRRGQGKPPARQRPT